MLVERLLLAERTGWSLREIDSMSVEEFRQTLEVYEAIDKARAWANRPRGGSGGGRHR